MYACSVSTIAELDEYLQSFWPGRSAWFEENDDPYHTRGDYNLGRGSGVRNRWRMGFARAALCQFGEAQCRKRRVGGCGDTIGPLCCQGCNPWHEWSNHEL